MKIEVLYSSDFTYDWPDQVGQEPDVDEHYSDIDYTEIDNTEDFMAPGRNMN